MVTLELPSLFHCAAATLKFVSIIYLLFSWRANGPTGRFVVNKAVICKTVGVSFNKQSEFAIGLICDRPKRPKCVSQVIIFLTVYRTENARGLIKRRTHLQLRSDTMQSNPRIEMFYLLAFSSLR